MKIIYILSFLCVVSSFVLSPKYIHFRESEKAIVQDTVKEWAEVNFEAQGIQNKMAYADTTNFMHQKIYPCARCFLRPEVADALEEANQIAKDKGYTLVIYDCYRPYGYQKVMYDIVNDPRYVAPPGKGSNHNRGRAIDLSLADENGNLLDMGTPFDDFSAKSHYEVKGLSREARRNRKALHTIMKRAGFTPYNNEWWHFDYKKQNYETSDFRWDCK